MICGFPIWYGDFCRDLFVCLINFFLWRDPNMPIANNSFYSVHRNVFATHWKYRISNADTVSGFLVGISACELNGRLHCSITLRLETTSIPFRWRCVHMVVLLAVRAHFTSPRLHSCHIPLIYCCNGNTSFIRLFDRVSSNNFNNRFIPHIIWLWI